jgi:hypothetical protein
VNRSRGKPRLLLAAWEHDQLDAVALAELLEDVCDIGRDRRLAEEEPGRRYRGALNGAAFDRKALNEEEPKGWIDQAQGLIDQMQALAASS